MDSWLMENRKQYEVFLGVTQLLLGRGFSPLSTEPYYDNAFRTDHTEAMMNLLRSFTPETLSWPLKVFSTGPLFRHGRSWSEAIDVEWVGDTGVVEELETVALIGDIARWLNREGVDVDDLTMVYGNVGWLRELGDRVGVPCAKVKTLIDDLRRGRLTSVTQVLGVIDARLPVLFHPQPAEQFFSLLSEWMPLSAPEMIGADDSWFWNTAWDLSLTGQKNYYTGINFSLYHRRSGQPLINGGKFEIPGQRNPTGGVGFTLYLDACRSVVGEVTHAL